MSVSQVGCDPQDCEAWLIVTVFQKLCWLHEVYAYSIVCASFLAAHLELFALLKPLPFHYASSRLFMGLPDILAAQINTHQSICPPHPFC